MPQTDFDRAACEGKHRFETRTMADKVNTRPRHHKKDRHMQVYRCPVCRMWHIGTRSRTR